MENAVGVNAKKKFQQKVALCKCGLLMKYPDIIVQKNVQKLRKLLCLRGQNMFQLIKNNEVIYEAEEINSLYIQLHRVQGQSWSYALTYGGYKIVKKETVSQ